MQALKQNHPYEEVAFDLFPLLKKSDNIGAGIIGTLDTAEDSMEFLNRLKSLTSAKCIKHTTVLKPKLRKIALCGGSGAFLIAKAKSANADIYISGDIKYHEFFDADNKILIADIGHYESEQFTQELLFHIIKEKFPTFAVQISDFVTNPINYL